jgi:hypothetical protein
MQRQLLDELQDIAAYSDECCGLSDYEGYGSVILYHLNSRRRRKIRKPILKLYDDVIRQLKYQSKPDSLTSGFLGLATLDESS